MKNLVNNPQRRNALARCAGTLVVGFVATLLGCASEQKPAKSQPVKSHDDPGPIVIKGSEDGRRYPQRARGNQAEIAELTSEAIASQGKDHGRPLRAREYVRTKADVQTELETNRSQIAEREAARKKLFEDERYAAGTNRPNMPDPDGVAAIDKQLGDLKANRATLEAELADFVAREDENNSRRSRAGESVRTRADVQGDLEVNRSRMAEREAARKKLFEDERYAAGTNRPNMPDPDSVAAIDKQLGDLKAQRAKLEAELSALEANGAR